MMRIFSKHFGCTFFLTLVVLSNVGNRASCEVTSLKPLNVSFYDSLRSLPSSVLNSETRAGSNVIRVSAPKNATNAVQTSKRLCHLASMVTVTTRGSGWKKIGMGSYGLFGAMLLAMLQFNNNIDSIVPQLTSNPVLKACNIKLTMEFHDEKYNAVEGSRIFYEDVISRKHSLANPLPCAFVGGGTSTVSAQLSTSSSVFDIPTISALSLSPDLDNKDRYPLFGRTVPTLESLGTAAATYFKEVLNVSHCGIIYGNDPLARSIHAAFVAAAEALDEPMVVVSAMLDLIPDEHSTEQALQHLAASGFNYFFSVASVPAHDMLMSVGSKLEIIGPGRYWLFSPHASKLLVDSFKYDAVSQAHEARATNGIGLIDSNIPLNEAFAQAWKSLVVDTTLKDYLASKQPKHVDTSGDIRFPDTPPFYFQFGFDAVMAIGIAACSIQDEYFSGTSLYEAIKMVNFTGASGRIRFDAKTGSRDTAGMTYKVTNIVRKEPNENNEVFFATSVVAHQVVHDEGKEWTTTKATMFADGTSIPPPSLYPMKEKVLRISPGVLAFGLGMAGVAMVASCYLVVWTVQGRNSHVIRAAQPAFLVLLCVGTFIMSSAVLPLSLQEPISQKGLDFACMASPWLFQIGFITSFSALLAKMKRINMIFRTKRFQRVVVNVRDVMLPFFCLLMANVVILSTWTVLEPLTYHRIALSYDKVGRTVESYGICKSSNRNKVLPFVFSLVFLDIVSIFFANVQTFRARNVCTSFSESRYIAVTMASLLQASVLGLPVTGAVMKNANPSGFFLVTSSLVTLMSFAILLPMFVPKMLAARKRRSQPGRRFREKPPSGVMMYEVAPHSVSVEVFRLSNDFQPFFGSLIVSRFALLLMLVTSKRVRSCNIQRMIALSRGDSEADALMLSSGAGKKLRKQKGYSGYAASRATSAAPRLLGAAPLYRYGQVGHRFRLPSDQLWQSLYFPSGEVPHSVQVHAVCIFG